MPLIKYIGLLITSYAGCWYAGQWTVGLPGLGVALALLKVSKTRKRKSRNATFVVLGFISYPLNYTVYAVVWAFLLGLVTLIVMQMATHPLFYLLLGGLLSLSAVSPSEKMDPFTLAQSFAAYFLYMTDEHLALLRPTVPLQIPSLISSFSPIAILLFVVAVAGGCAWSLRKWVRLVESRELRVKSLRLPGPSSGELGGRCWRRQRDATRPMLGNLTNAHLEARDMSVFEAEIRGKLPLWEDSLTADFFGVPELLPFDVGLRPFLSNLGIAVGENQEWRIRLWDWLGRTEPDVVISSGNCALIVEAKLGSALYDRQLIMEYEDGLARYGDSDMHLVAIIKNITEPAAVEKARVYLEATYGHADVQWRSWSDLYPILRRAVRDGGLAHTVSMLASDLLRLFEKHGLRGFDMFAQRFASMDPSPRFAGEFILFAREVAKKASMDIHDYVWKDIDISASDQEPPLVSAYLPHDIRIHLFDKQWGYIDCHRCPYLSCPLLEAKPRIRYGYWMAFFDGWRPIHLHLIKENWKQIVNGLARLGDVKAEFWGPRVPISMAADRQLVSDAERYRAINFELGLWESEDNQLPPAELVDRAVAELTHLREAVNNLGLAKTHEENSAFLKALKESDQGTEPQVENGV